MRTRWEMDLVAHRGWKREGDRQKRRNRESAAIASTDLVRNESPGFDTLEGVIAPSLHAVVWDLLPAMQMETWENASVHCCFERLKIRKGGEIQARFLD